MDFGACPFGVDEYVLVLTPTGGRMAVIAELDVADWHRLNRLLETALGLEPEARTAWLHEMAARNADLLPLLEQLLSPAT